MPQRGGWWKWSPPNNWRPVRQTPTVDQSPPSVSLTVTRGEIWSNINEKNLSWFRSAATCRSRWFLRGYAGAQRVTHVWRAASRSGWPELTGRGPVGPTGQRPRECSQHGPDSVWVPQFWCRLLLCDHGWDPILVSSNVMVFFLCFCLSPFFFYEFNYYPRSHWDVGPICFFHVPVCESYG